MKPGHVLGGKKYFFLFFNVESFELFLRTYVRWSFSHIFSVFFRSGCKKQADKFCKGWLSRAVFHIIFFCISEEKKSYRNIKATLEKNS